METKWLEDFLSVVQTFNFSRSAKLRNVTQPAFCRRIRALENWLGPFHSRLLWLHANTHLPRS